MVNQEKNDIAEIRRKDKWENIWKNTLYVLIAILLYCIPGFLSFKDLAVDRGYRFVSSEAWWWALLAFTVYGVNSFIFSQVNMPTFP